MPAVSVKGHGFLGVHAAARRAGPGATRGGSALRSSNAGLHAYFLTDQGETLWIEEVVGVNEHHSRGEGLR